MSATTDTERTINAVARQIAAKIATDLGGDYTRASAGRDNAAGWTIWFPAPTGGAVVHAGIVLNDDALKRAWRRAVAAS